MQVTVDGLMASIASLTTKTDELTSEQVEKANYNLEHIKIQSYFSGKTRF